VYSAKSLVHFWLLASSSASFNNEILLMLLSLWLSEFISLSKGVWLGGNVKKKAVVGRSELCNQSFTLSTTPSNASASTTAISAS
jgi:hypothetical protein